MAARLLPTDHSAGLRPRRRYLLIIAVLICLALVFLHWLGATSGAHLGHWFTPTFHHWFHVAINGSIGLSYIAISATLAYLVARARQSIPYHHVFLAFGAFILSCGLGHFAHIWTLYHPTSPLEGYVGLITALASIATAVVLPPLVPRVLHLIHSAQVSDQRQAIIQQQQAFFTTVAHELKTPLTTMVGYVDLLQRRLAKAGNVNDSVARTVGSLSDQTHRLRRLIESLLDLARMQQGTYVLEREPLELQALITAVTERYRVTLSPAHELVLVSDGQPAWVNGNDVAIEQLLLNLLQNAVKYSPAGGRITVGLAQIDQAVILQVADQGIGIAAADQIRLGEQFFRGQNGETTTTSGFGVGLYVVREILQQHDGTLTITSREGAGATFTIRLPRLMDEPTTVTTPASVDRAEVASFTAND